MSPIIDNFTDHYDISQSFRNFFSSTYVDSRNDNNAFTEFTNLKSSLGLPVKNNNIAAPTITDIENAVKQLSYNKSPDHEHLLAEHIHHSHPAIFLHLKNLFTLIINHSYVPKSFTYGTVLPIPEDNRGDRTSSTVLITGPLLFVLLSLNLLNTFFLKK